MKSPRVLKLAGLGCGARTRTYLKLASDLPHLYAIEGAADPVPERIEFVRKLPGISPSFRSFASGEELLAADKFADVVIVGTQDADHKEHCLAAMRKGYDVLLEKPIATSPEDILLIEQVARELGRKVLVCHVLRYTPFYRKLKEIVDSGALGEIISLNATEGVNPWHQAHSFVRGFWAVTEKATPMIVAKCCHDLDIISWLIGQPCRLVGSCGGLSLFRKDRAPQGAPARCTDGCPAAPACSYNALLYTSVHRGWLENVMDGAAGADETTIVKWLEKSPWGRCVYQCDNTAVDHQVVAMEFAGGATATLTMTAFESDRHIEIFGTEGVLRGGGAVRAATGSEIVIRRHATNETTRVPVPELQGGYESHGGGDLGLILALHDEMNRPNAADMSTSLTASVESHLMGFAAESSRLEGKMVPLCAVGNGDGAKKPDFAGSTPGLSTPAVRASVESKFR